MVSRPTRVSGNDWANRGSSLASSSSRDLVSAETFARILFGFPVILCTTSANNLRATAGFVVRSKTKRVSSPRNLSSVPV